MEGGVVVRGRGRGPGVQRTERGGEEPGGVTPALLLALVLLFSFIILLALHRTSNVWGW